VTASDRKEVANDRLTMSSSISAIASAVARAVFTMKGTASIAWLGMSGSGAVAEVRQQRFQSVSDSVKRNLEH